MQYPKPGDGPDRAAALAQYRHRAAHYDSELAVFEPIRAQAIENLALRIGDKVLDVGCGTGLSLQGLHDRIGKAGRIAGIEQCAEMLDRARARAEAARWTNVDLLCAPAARAKAAFKADAALFHFAGGVGLRFALKDDDRLNIRIDRGWGRGTSGTYFTIGEAF